MLKQFISRLFGDPQAREIQQLQPLVDRINALEPEMQARDDAGLRALTGAFRDLLSQATAEPRQRIAALSDELTPEMDADKRAAWRDALERARAQLDKEERAVLDDILPQAFAAVREAAVRSVGLRHFDVQLIGGIVLHQGSLPFHAT